jgi:hypothetical protein
MPAPFYAHAEQFARRRPLLTEMGTRLEPPLVRSRGAALRSRVLRALPDWARTRGVVVRRRWRHLTAPARVLPQFVVIGAQKGGTSSLYNYLTAHPAVVRAATKEIHYFDLNYHLGENWYRGHFPTRRRIARIGHRLGVHALTGEASPYYLFHPRVPGRVKALLPDARFIVVLRDPIERAVSHHNHEVIDGYETLDLVAAIDAEPRRLAGEVKRLATSDRHNASFSHQHQSYLSRGQYAEQLERWFALFPRERFLIIESRELFDNPAAVTARAFEFLGLPPCDSLSYDIAGARPHANLDPELRRRLTEHFAPHNQRLDELLGARLGWEDECR